MELKCHHIQIGEKELTNAKFLLQNILKRTSGEIVSENDKLFINTISSGLVQWLDGFIKQIEMGKEIEENALYNRWK